MLSDTSQALQVLMIGDVPAIDWLQARFAQLVPPAMVKWVAGPEETDRSRAYHLILVQDLTLVERETGALVCQSRIAPDGSVHLMAADPRQQPVVHLVEQYLHMRPDAARMAEQMRLVNEVSLEIAGIHDLEEILSLVTDRLTETFGYYHAAVGLLVADYIEMYESRRSRRTVEPERFRITLDAPGMLPWVARTGVAHLSNDTLQDTLWIPGKGLEESRSEVTVPLVYHGRVIGVIDVQSQQTGAFDQGDVSVLGALAGELAVAIENVRLLDESRRQHRLAETLSRISRLATALLDVEQVSQMVLRELDQLIAFDAALIALYENDAFRVAHQIGYGSKDARPLRWLLEESPILYRVVSQREPIWIADTTDDRLWQKTTPEQAARSWLGAPLLSRERPIGVVAVARFVPHAYRQADADILMALANQIAGVIDNAQLIEQSEQREREARALYEITHLLVTLDQETIAPSLLRQLREAVVFDAAGILISGEVPRISVIAGREVAESTLAELVDRLCKTFNALSRDPVNPNTIPRHVIRVEPFPEAKPVDHLPSRLSAPLLVGRRVAGVIELCKADPTPYTDAQLRTLYTIANSTATALENARLYQDLVARAINLQQAVDELAEADRLKDELVGTVSHELRSPLTYIMGYVDLLLIGEMGELSDDQRRSLEIVASKTKTLARLVSDILSLEKTQTDDLMLAPVHLTDVAQRVVQDVGLTAEEAGIQVVTEWSSCSATVLADEGRIEQVFNNLLGNALKFSPAGSTVTVRVFPREQNVRAEVADTGIGIPEDKLSRIFDRFFQVNMESRRRGGVGLGLAICKQIIEAHGGQIGVTSQLGVGSTFYFELPSFGASE
jgi:signal transduction histidine kinase